MMETIEVKIKGKKYKLSKGMTLEEISKEFQKDFKYPILLAKVNNKLEELTKTVEDNATIEFYDLTSREGNKTHISGLTYVLLYAIKKLFGEEAWNEALASVDGDLQKAEKQFISKRKKQEFLLF